MKIKLSIRTVVAAVLLLPGFAFAMQNEPAPVKTTGKSKTVSKQVTPQRSTQDIADAKSKGLVWVNEGTGVYHKDGEFYGKTKRGKFLTEDEARKAGYHMAKEPAASKKTTSRNTKKMPGAETSGVDATAATHASPPVPPAPKR